MESVFETLVEDKLEEESTLTSKCGALIVVLAVLLPVVAEITTSVVFLWVWGVEVRHSDCMCGCLCTQGHTGRLEKYESGVCEAHLHDQGSHLVIIAVVRGRTKS